MQQKDISRREQRKLKFEIFLSEVPIYIIEIASIVLCAYFHGKYIEALFVVVGTLLLRYKFYKTYHSYNCGVCFAITMSIIWLSIPIATPLYISLLGSTSMSLLITYISFFVQEYIEVSSELQTMKKENNLIKAKNQELIDNNKKSIQEMNETEFIQYCQHHGLLDHEIKVADLVLRQNVKGTSFYYAIGYSVAQVKRIRKKVIKKLNEEI